MLLSIGLNAQFNYQAIVKDSNGNLVTNNVVSFKFSLMYQSANASPFYIEEHSVITPSDGVVNFSVGGGTVVNGTFSDIDWSQSVFMKEELDTGNGYQDMGTKQISSVPVAEYAKRVAGLNTISSTITLDSNITSFNTTGVVSASSFRGNADQTTLTYSGTVTNVLAVISDLQRQIEELKELVNAGICLPKLSHQINDYTLTEGEQAVIGEIYGMIDFCPQNNSGTASVTITGTVPSGLSFNWEDTTMDYKLVGTPAVGTAGTYSLTVVASIGSTTLTDNFILKIVAFDTPRGLAFDNNGNLYVSQYDGQIKIVADGQVSNYLHGFDNPISLTFNNQGHLIVSNHNSNTLVVMDGINPIQTYNINRPRGVYVDSSNNMYVCQQGGHVITKISSDGQQINIAGNGTAGYQDGNGTASKINSPSGIVADSNGNLFFTSMYAVKKIDIQTGYVSTFAGQNRSSANGGDGYVNSSDPTQAYFNILMGIAIDENDNLYVTEAGRIRKITPNGAVSTLAGNEPGELADGIGENARFHNLYSITFRNLIQPELYVPDQENGAIRKITLDGVVTTYK